MAIGSSGARNAAIYAVQILSVKDAKLASLLDKFKKSQRKKVLDKDKKVGAL
jgi:5-(carboxyamino)imidazole ribonucleotide mutase